MSPRPLFLSPQLWASSVFRGNDEQSAPSHAGDFAGQTTHVPRQCFAFRVVQDSLDTDSTRESIHFRQPPYCPKVPGILML